MDFIQLVDAYNNPIGLYIHHDPLINQRSILDVIEEYFENPCDFDEVELDDHLSANGFERIFVDVEYINENPYI